MARYALASVISYGLVALTSFASSPPNLEKTLAAQQRLVAEHSYDSQAHNDLGNLLVLAGRDAEAEASYRRAIELDGANAPARFNIAVLMQQLGRAEEALTELRQLLEVDPYHGWGHYQLGVLYEERGERTKAVEHYARAFAYDPDLTFASNNPHIIDNRLSTEALLLSQRYLGSQAARVPRHYADPQRIVEMMLEIEEEEAEDEAAAAASEEESESAAPGEAPRRQRSRLRGDGAPATGAAGGAAPAGGSAGADEEDEEDEEDEGDGGADLVVIERPAGGRTVVGTGDRTPRSSSSRARSAPAAGAAGREQPPAGAAAAPGSTRRGSSAAPATPPAPTRTEVAPRRLRYRPGRVSTGRLELRLLPEEPAERRAEIGARG